MSADKKTETPKQEPKPSAPETNKEQNAELTEEELRRVTGGRLGPGPMPLNPQPLPPG